MFSLRHVSLVLLASALSISGCGKHPVVANENMRELTFAVLAYQDEHGKWPDKLEDTKPLFGKKSALPGSSVVIGNGKDLATLLANPYSGDNPGYEYVKPPDSTMLGNGDVVIIYQINGGKRDTTLSVAFADGHIAPLAGK
jgi:hypothetical protein